MQQLLESHSDLAESAVLANYAYAQIGARPRKLRLGYHKYFESPEHSELGIEEGKVSAEKRTRPTTKISEDQDEKF